MPAERINVSFEPRPLELLYHKYGPSKFGPTPATASSSTVHFPQHNPSHLKPTTTGTAAAARGSGKKLGHAFGDLPPRISRRQELGDLKKLGRELTKMERVQMFFDMSNHTVCSAKAKSRSQPSSAGPKNLPCWSSACTHCAKERQRQDEAHRAKLKDLKSKLRLVASRTLPSSHTRHCQSQESSSPLRHSSQHVVPLPLLPLGYKRNVASSEDFSVPRDASHLFLPQPSISRRTAAAWNYRFHNGLPVPCQGAHKGHDGAEWGDSSPPQLPYAAAPACSPADDLCETKTATTFDADRVDSEQFGYVFDQLSGDSSSESWVTSARSDTATYSARAQRPSTTDSVPTPQRYVETRASVAAPLSPTSPRPKGRDAECWPPQYTVVPSWPSVDDPFRYQYFGYNVHRDLMRRLHKRGRKRNSKHSHGTDAEQRTPPPPEPQKLKVVMPSYTDNALDSEVGSTVRHAPVSVVPSCPRSVTVKSAKSRDSLSMSVCTVLSRQAQPVSSQEAALHKLKDQPRLYKPLDENGYRSPFFKDRSMHSHSNSLD